MEQFFTLPFFILEVPNMKIKRPSWLHQPSATSVFAVVLLSYFLVTGGNKYLYKVLKILINLILGIIYDVIVEPPSVGSTTDEHGHSRPVCIFLNI